MRKFLWVIIPVFVLCFSAVLSASDPFESITTGDVKKYVDSTKTQKDYPNSDIIMLLSYYSVYMKEDGLIRTRLVERIKILNERGFGEAKKVVSYRDGYSNARILYANTIKPDGTVMKVEEKDIKDYSEYSDYEFYSDIKLKTFTMPSIEPGVILELCWEKEEYKSDFPYDKLDKFRYFSGVPMLLDVGEIDVPKSVPFKYKLFNLDQKPEITEYGSRVKYVFTNKDRDEVKPEVGMPDLWDIETFPVHMSWTLPGWDGIAKWTSLAFKKQMNAGDELTAFTKDLTKDSKTELDKVKAIFHFVTRKIRYVAVELGPNTFEPHPANEIFKKRYGDCKDKTVLLMTMLKVAGIDSKPALVPKDDDEFSEERPSIGNFNHVVAQATCADGKTYWLDGTYEFQAVGGPLYSKAIKVMLIEPDGTFKFVKTEPSSDAIDYTLSTATLTIDQQGDCTLKSVVTACGISSDGDRSNYKYTAPDDMLRGFEQDGVENPVSDHTDCDNVYEPFTSSLLGSVKNVVQIVDEDTIIMKNPVSLWEYDDLVTAKTRKFPILFAAGAKYKKTSEYILPEGFTAKNLPKDYTIKKPWGLFEYKYTCKDNKLTVIREQKAEHAKLLPAEFEDFKKYATENQNYNKKYKNIIFVRKAQVKAAPEKAPAPEKTAPAKKSDGAPAKK